ncbi:hypothetical protein PTKIN_Ptkin12aG0089800 [Pterospermum kingtungense]
MGVHLRNLSYLGLNNNNLEAKVPQEFKFLEFTGEINLEKNNLSGRAPVSAKFTAKVGEKLRLKGNPELCMDERLSHGKSIHNRLGIEEIQQARHSQCCPIR